MEKVKLILKNHWRLLVFEFVPITIYVVASVFIDKNTIQDSTILSIVFSAEFFVAMIVGIAAVYSWIHHKKISDLEITDAKYSSDLHLLQNIDELLEVYRNKGEERKIGFKIEGFIYKLEKIYENKKNLEPRYEFLYIYYQFLRYKIRSDQDTLDEDIDQEDRENDKKVSNTQDSSSAVSHGFLSDKTSPDQDNMDENVYQEDKENDRKVSKTQDNSSAVSHGFLSDKTSPDQDNLDIKTKISRELGVNKKNIRYSKNYENDAKRDNLKWTTWFTLSENTIDDLEVDDKQIFITNVDGKDIIFQIRGKDLKDMISEGKIRKRPRAGKTVYDFFFGQDFKENFVEGKRRIDLGKYNIEILSDSKVLNNE